MKLPISGFLLGARETLVAPFYMHLFDTSTMGCKVPKASGMSPQLQQRKLLTFDWSGCSSQQLQLPVASGRHYILRQSYNSTS
jgi:hypothetical protein